MDQPKTDRVTQTQIVALVTAALHDFYIRDQMLFRDLDDSNAVSERTMAARIGFYLERHRGIIGSLDELSIDLEYNRNFNAPKSIYSLMTQQRRNVIPDLLIHLRNSNEENFLVIEFKKGTPPRSQQLHDEEKLRYFTDPRWEYRYRYGMSIELHPHNARITLYREGHPVETFCYM